MAWISERMAAFTAAAGHRRYMMGGIVTLAVGLSDFLRDQVFGASESILLRIPSWIFAIVVGLGFVAWWLLEELVRLRRQIKGARVDLAKLRTEGVEIRNDGMRISSLIDFQAWEPRALVWNERVIENMRKISEADAEWFSVLDVVPISPRVSASNFLDSAYVKLFREHDYRVMRLGEMVYRLWKD